MAHVIDPTGRDLGEITNRAELDYYQREPGFSIDGDVVPDPIDPAPEVLQVAPDDLGTGGVEGAPKRPEDDALKAEWIAYAKSVDPDNAEWIDASGTTKADLVSHYGG